MKLPTLAALLAFSAGSASAITITHEKTIVSTSGFDSLSTSLPLFDVPDVLLEEVRIYVTQTVHASLQVTGQPGESVLASMLVESFFFFPTMRRISDGDYFTKQLIIGANGTASRDYSIPLIISDAFLDESKFIPSGGATEFAINGATSSTGTINSVETNYRVVYTYGVPDGGSTLPLLAVGLLSCRWIKSRRLKGSRS